MLTNDAPERNHIIVARGRGTEGSRLKAAPAVVVRIEGFNNVKLGKSRVRSDRALGLQGVSAYGALLA